jgi:hypothetical protein
MSRRNSITVVALAMTLASCAGASAGPSHIGSELRYQTVRELVSGADQPQPRVQLLEIARFIRGWERDPFGPTNPPNPEQEPSTPALMIIWLTASPDVAVTVCPGVVAIAEEQAGEGAAAGFLVGAGFGMAAYMIENPDEAADPDGANVQGAGIESGLLWFEAYRRRGEAQGAPILDELIQLRNAGGRAALQQYHADHIRCGSHRDEPLP